MRKYKSVGKLNGNVYVHTFLCRRCERVSHFNHACKTAMTYQICNRHPRKNEWLYVPVKFVNVVSGRVSSAKSIVAFCKRHKELGKNAKYHFTPVIKKERLHYKGWMLPEMVGTVDKSKIQRITQLLVKPAMKY